MKLVEDGITRLEVPVAEILPQFNTTPYNQINLFHLLTHTSGLYPDGGCFENKYQTSYWGIIDAAYKLCEDGKKSDFDWIAAALGVIGNGLRTKPGTEWAYSTFGFTLLGAIIEKLTGMNAHTYIEDTICKPLGMKDSSFTVLPEKVKRWIVTDEESETFLKEIENGTHKPEWVGEILHMPGTGGGLDSTVYDLSRFGNMLLAGGTLNGTRILGRKAVERMTTRAIDVPDDCWHANDPHRSYGIGFDMREHIGFTFSKGTFMHEGFGASAFYVDPKEEFVAAWITPYVEGKDWVARALWSAQNVMWSGLI
jgi:CubicO group peptidase (beta-lactamase class C family)